MPTRHQKQWDFLVKKFKVKQLSHAYLFSGAKEIGKKIFALEFVKLLNCSATENKPCQKCVSCQMINRECFSDLMLVGPGNNNGEKEAGAEIRIVQVRQINNFLSYKPYFNSYKAVIIDNAQKMNQEAQSCFLKTLEEPRGQTVIILISSMSEMLLPTIFSRCQQIKFFRPKNLSPNQEKEKMEKEIIQEILSVGSSALADKFRFAKSVDFQRQGLEDILEATQKYFRKLLLSKAGVNYGEAPPQAEKYSLEKIINIINLTEDISNKLIFTNVNPKLALELLLMEM